MTKPSYDAIATKTTKKHNILNVVDVCGGRFSNVYNAEAVFYRLVDLMCSLGHSCLLYSVDSNADRRKKSCLIFSKYSFHALRLLSAKKKKKNSIIDQVK